MAHLPLTATRVSDLPPQILLAYYTPHFYAVSSLMHHMGLAPEKPRRGRQIVISGKCWVDINGQKERFWEVWTPVT